MQNNPDSLDVSLNLAGSLIAVGLPWDKEIFIQEYWLHDIPYYAVASTSDKTIEISVNEWTGEVGNKLLGTWLIDPKKVQCYALSNIKNYQGNLIAISLKDNQLFGLLTTPKALSQLTIAPSNNEILTISGLNGTGSRSANVLCWQPKMSFVAGDKIFITLQLQENIQFIEIDNNFACILPKATVVDAFSNSLKIEKTHQNITISNLNLGDNIQQLNLEVVLPETSENTFAVLSGYVRYQNGSGCALSRGIIMNDDMG